MNLAHGAAVDILRARVPGSSIGAIHNYQPCLPSTPADAEAAKRCDAYWNKAFPDPQCLGAYPESAAAVDRGAHASRAIWLASRRPVDWFGLNHYSPVFVKDDSSSLLNFGFGDKPAELPGNSEWLADFAEGI